MKRSLLSASLALAVAIGSIGIVPLAKAAAGDSTTFFMTKSAGALRQRMGITSASETNEGSKRE